MVAHTLAAVKLWNSVLKSYGLMSAILTGDIASSATYDGRKYEFEWIILLQLSEYLHVFGNAMIGKLLYICIASN